MFAEGKQTLTRMHGTETFLHAYLFYFSVRNELYHKNYSDT